MTAPLYSQEGFRFRSDEAGVVWLEDENVDRAQQINVQFRLRIEVENTNNRGGGGGIEFSLYVQRNGAGGYGAVAASAYVSPALSAEFADGDADNVDRLATSSAPFDEGVLDETGTENVSIGSNDHAEIEYCIVIDGGSPTDTYDFRVYGGGSPLNNYADTPRVTAEAPPPACGWPLGRPAGRSSR